MFAIPDSFEIDVNSIHKNFATERSVFAAAKK